MTDMTQNFIHLKKLMLRIVTKAMLAGLAVVPLTLTASSQTQDKQQTSSTPQQASVLPQFEVATIKPNHSPDPNNDKGYWRAVKGDEIKITMRNGNLLAFIEEAYGVKPYQITGPDWLKSERFDIVAIASHVRKDQLRPMLQSLLKERFKLEVHRESKVLPVYALVQGKNGAKIQAIKPDGESGVWDGIGKLTAKKITMTHFAETLSSQMDRPVVDTTGLEGVFDFTLEYTKQEVQPKFNADGVGTAAPDLESGQSIFSALQEQLGLKLESRKAPVEMLVIDHAEKEPTEN